MSTATARPSIIIPSRDCPAEWLWDTITCPWFGDVELLCDADTADAIPRLVDDEGEVVTGEA